MPNMLDDIFTASAQLKQNLSDWFGISARSYCRLYTTDVEGVIVADDASMVSLIEIQGSLKLIGTEEFEDVATRLHTCLQTPLNACGHALQFVYCYDPTTAGAQIKRHFAPLKQTADTLRLDIHHVLDDWRDTLTHYCSDERLFLAVWTRPTTMTQAEYKSARKELKQLKGPSVSSDAQSLTVTIERMRDIHLASVKDIQAAFGALNFRTAFLDSHTAIREIRACLVPRHTAPDWRPRLLGDPLPLRRPDPGMNDMSHIMPPTVATQLWPTGATIHADKYIQVDDLIFAPVVMQLPPQTMTPFNALFRNLSGEGIPWRMSVLLTGDGMRGSMLKSTISSILSFTSLNNRLFNRAFDQLKEAQLRGECSVGFQVTLCTWVEANTPAAQKMLAQRSARLRTAVQSWGSCDTTDLIGDPLLGLSATLPGYMPTSPAPAAIAPLTDAVRLLPLMRPTSPWTATDLPLRTPDGRYMPVGLFTSLQASWNEICFAGMGAGKSFFLNTLNMFFCLRPGQVRLPWLTIIDIGSSCSGVITLIRAALPDDQKHLAVFALLSNTADSSINPFDTPLGCHMPLTNHNDFLINLLALLCTPLDEKAPMDGVTGLLREAITYTYKNLSPKGGAAKKYDPHIEPEIHARLAQAGYALDVKTTWWEVTEFLYEMGHIALAVKAQRHAMPLLPDIAVTCNNQLLADQYRKITNTGGENIPDACNRHLTDATRDYPLLANPTKFDLGAAQIVGLDLQKVTPSGGPQAERQAGIMYMIARYVGAAHFFLSQRDLAQVPEKYREYHRPRFESLASDPKRLCFDEFHRASCANMSNPLTKQIISDLTTASREARKQNLSIGLYSQALDDFPSAIVDLATNIYVLGAGSAQAAEDIAKRFGLNNAAKNAIRRISKPTRAGANFIALFTTTFGESTQYLTNCAGPLAKWAFSTTAEDMQVRNRLYDILGCKKTLITLTKSYPDGSIKPEIERRQITRETVAGEDAADIVQEIIEELLIEAKSV